MSLKMLIDPFTLTYCPIWSCHSPEPRQRPKDEFVPGLRILVIHSTGVEEQRMVRWL